jgi:hypothetical protein
MLAFKNSKKGSNKNSNLRSFRCLLTRTTRKAPMKDETDIHYSVSDKDKKGSRKS